MSRNLCCTITTTSLEQSPSWKSWQLMDAKGYSSHFGELLWCVSFLVNHWFNWFPSLLLQLVFSSSATVYGWPKKVPCTEEFPLNVANPYGRTKVLSIISAWICSAQFVEVQNCRFILSVHDLTSLSIVSSSLKKYAVMSNTRTLNGKSYCSGTLILLVLIQVAELVKIQEDIRTTLCHLFNKLLLAEEKSWKFMELIMQPRMVQGYD